MSKLFILAAALSVLGTGILLIPSRTEAYERPVIHDNAYYCRLAKGFMSLEDKKLIEDYCDSLN